MSEAVIVGGGLAGAAAAILLARAGRRATVLERDAEPRHRICGEFLSAGAQRRLDALGLDAAALGGERIGAVRIVAGARTVEARLPFVALGLTRRRLDAALLDRAAAGAEVLRGVAVRSVAGDALATSLGPLPAPTLLLATGKHELRGLPRATEGCDDDHVGFKTYWRLPAPARAALSGHVEIVVFDGGYAGLQLVEGGIANLCLNVARDTLAAFGGWDALLAALVAGPHLGRRLADAEPLLPRPLTIAGVPYGYRHRPDPAETAYRLGDQAAVIPSFCGDGMAMALDSAFHAASAVVAGRGAAAHHRALRARFARQMTVAMALHRAGTAPAVRGPLLGLLAAVPRLAGLLAALTRVPERGSWRGQRQAARSRAGPTGERP